MAGLKVRKGIRRVEIPEQVVLPRPVVRAGLLNRQGQTDVPAITNVGSHDVWQTRWATTGEELPFERDWLWYAAILTICAGSKMKFQLEVELQTVTEAQRLASGLGMGRKGGVMAYRTADAIKRLCQARFGWCRGETGEGNLNAARQLTVEPILRISSGLAAALWGKKLPVGILVVEDARLWVGPTIEHLALTRDMPFRVPKIIFSDLAKNPDHLSIGLWIAAYSQAATQKWPIGRNVWESLLTRTTDCPITRVQQRVEAAAAHLNQACADAGFPNAVPFDPNDQKVEFKPHLPGRPREKWGFRISPAAAPFIR